MNRHGNETGVWTRRRWVRQALGWAAGAGLLGSGMTAYARRIEPDWLSIERVRVPVPRLPEGLAGFTVAHLSDFHADGYLTDRLLEAVVASIQEARPDMIALTGDFITSNRAGMDRLAQWVGRMNARHGIFGCMGNHDRWHGRGYVETALQRMGAELLINRGVLLAPGLFVGGVDSAWGGKPDLASALSAHTGAAPALLLAHEPDWADAYAKDPRVRVQLSGHTHGGQIRVPGWGAPVLPRYGQKYDAGLFRVGDLRLYTNRGLGMVGVPFRFACPPELTLLTLEPAEAKPA